MAINVLVSVCVDEEWIDVLKNLETQCDFRIRYFVGFSKMEHEVRNSFNDIIFESTGNFLSGLEVFHEHLQVSDDVNAIPNKSFDFDLLEKLSKYEFMTKYLINREYEKGSDRTNEIYFEIINYWQKVLDYTKPVLIIVPWTPYTAREYVLYALSQVYNIKFLTFRQSIVRPYLYIPVFKPEDIFIENIVLKYNEIRKKSPFSSRITDYNIQPYAQKRVQEIMDKQSNSILDETQQEIKSSTSQNKHKKSFNQFFTILKDNHNFKKDNSLNPCNKYRSKEIINFLYTSITKFPKKLIEHRNTNINRKEKEQGFKNLKTQYDKYCITPDFNRPFIYFPLHYQPEQTTAPFGKYAVYQYLPIEMIAKSLPENWVLYIKEHHTTFSPMYGGLKKRNREFYERILKNPNVAFIPMETQSVSLIDHSRAVATITGSTGIEAILRGKPALTFGCAIYNGCEGVFPIQSLEDCRKALNVINNGIKIDYREMLLFLQATDEIGAKVRLSQHMKNTGDTSITRENTIQNLTQCISDIWDKSLKDL